MLASNLNLRTTIMRVNIVLLSSVLPVAFAYSNTHPVIAWASHKYEECQFNLLSRINDIDYIVATLRFKLHHQTTCLRTYYFLTMLATMMLLSW